MLFCERMRQSCIILVNEITWKPHISWTDSCRWNTETQTEFYLANFSSYFIYASQFRIFWKTFFNQIVCNSTSFHLHICSWKSYIQMKRTTPLCRPNVRRPRFLAQMTAPHGTTRATDSIRSQARLCQVPVIDGMAAYGMLVFAVELGQWRGHTHSEWRDDDSQKWVLREPNADSFHWGLPCFAGLGLKQTMKATQQIIETRRVTVFVICDFIFLLKITTFCRRATHFATIVDDRCCRNYLTPSRLRESVNSRTWRSKTKTMNYVTSFRTIGFIEDFVNFVLFCC